MTPTIRESHRTGTSRLTRQRRGAIFLLSLLVLLACGTTVLTVRIDVKSFLTDEYLLLDYEAPGNLPDDVHFTTPKEIVPLPDELNSVTDISAVEIRAVNLFRNETGSATLLYEIFFHSDTTGIFDTPSIVDPHEIQLDSATVTRDTLLIEGDQRVLSLFAGDEIVVAAKVTVRPGDGSGFISGVVETEELTVLISAVGEQ